MAVHKFESLIAPGEVVYLSDEDVERMGDKMENLTPLEENIDVDVPKAKGVTGGKITATPAKPE